MTRADSEKPAPNRGKIPPFRRITRGTRIAIGTGSLAVAAALLVSGNASTALWIGLLGAVFLWDVVSELLGKGWPAETLDAYRRAVALEAIGMAVLAIVGAALGTSLLLGFIEPQGGPAFVGVVAFWLAASIFGRMAFLVFRDLRRESPPSSFPTQGDQQDSDVDS